MNLQRLDERAQKRISGDAWQTILPTFTRIHEQLISVSKSARGNLTTIYIKYVADETGNQPFAVLWVRKSTELTLGLALPEGFCHELVRPPRPNMKYTSLTGYLDFTAEVALPADLGQLVKMAFQNRQPGGS